MTVTASKNTGYLVHIPGLSEEVVVPVDFEGFVAAHPANRRTRRYVLKFTHNWKGFGTGYVPVDDDVTHYLSNSSRQGTSRRSGGYYQPRLTESLADAKSFATYEGAEKYLADHLTHDVLKGDGDINSCYSIVSEVVPADVSTDSAWHGRIKGLAV